MPRASSVSLGKYHGVGGACQRNARIDDTPLPERQRIPTRVTVEFLPATMALQQWIWSHTYKQANKKETEPNAQTQARTMMMMAFIITLGEIM